MAFTTASKFEVNLTAVATSKKIPLNILKRIIMRLFDMAPFTTIPDKVSFVEEAKAFKTDPNAKGETLEVVRTQRLLLNGDNTMTIGLRKGEGTNLATLTAYIMNAGRSVVDMRPYTTT